MVVVAGNYAYLCGMRKLLCPQCKIAALYVVNDRKERLLVYVLENGEVVPKDPAASTDGYDGGLLFGLFLAWFAEKTGEEIGDFRHFVFF